MNLYLIQKLLGYLVEFNKITCSRVFFFLLKNWTIQLTLYFHIHQFVSYIINKVLIEHIILFYYCYNRHKPKKKKKLKYQEEI